VCNEAAKEQLEAIAANGRRWALGVELSAGLELGGKFVRWFANGGSELADATVATGAGGNE